MLRITNADIRSARRMEHLSRYSSYRPLSRGQYLTISFYWFTTEPKGGEVSTKAIKLRTRTKVVKKKPVYYASSKPLTHQSNCNHQYPILHLNLDAVNAPDGKGAAKNKIYFYDTN